MVARNKPELKRALPGGVVAGVVGGLVIALFMLAMNIARGIDPWIGLKTAGYPFLGERALQPGFEAGPVVLGVLSHLAVSVGWGLLFGVLAYGLSPSATVLAGLGYGVLVWIGMSFLVLPLVGAGDLVADAPAGAALFQHVVLFGLPLGLAFLPFQRERVALGVGGAPLPAGAR